MATPRYYDADGNEITPPARAVSIATWATTAACVMMVLIVGAVALPSLIKIYLPTAAAPADAPPAPTLDPAARQQLQHAAPATSSEAQAVNQAIPTENVATPPLLPAQATAATIHQASTLDDVAPASLSPVDLVWVPIPTPTTMLSQEQYDASQASEEQQFLDNAEQGLTEAQKLVRIHEAEQAAKGRP